MRTIRMARKVCPKGTSPASAGGATEYPTLSASPVARVTEKKSALDRVGRSVSRF